MDCHHCGEYCKTKVEHENHTFCCHGCKTVYEILTLNELGNYYSLKDRPGIQIKSSNKEQNYSFLDLPEISDSFIQFNDESITKVTFSIPQIHCSSCIWLLENLGRLNDSILYSNVNFHTKIVSITYQSDLALSELAALLNQIGYSPDLNTQASESSNKRDRSIFYKIGIAGFCFGNIMLLSFPEYLGLDSSFEAFRGFFGYISLILSLPLLFYAGSDYLKNAVQGIRQRYINMDIPIALGIVTLFGRSLYEIMQGIGPGYLDSLSGLIFFLLIGKWFQQKTYEALSFERNYKSYFPIAVNRVENGHVTPVKIDQLSEGDLIEFRNNELVPADGTLENTDVQLDYSFVTGESDPIPKKVGDMIYAGGRIVGDKVLIRITKRVDNSYLTQLWNESAFEKPEELSIISEKVSKYFTIGILLITAVTALYWFMVDPSLIWNSVSAVLIVACPCALALSIPFTFGAIMRNMGKHGLYLKNTRVIERLAKISTVVLDKTGTITHKNANHISYSGTPLNSQITSAIKSLTGNSLHPHSQSIHKSLATVEPVAITEYTETQGAGISAKFGEHCLQIGSADFIGTHEKNAKIQGSVVHIALDHEYYGSYSIQQKYRQGIKGMIAALKSRFTVELLSGDNDQQRDYIEREFQITSARFHQQPIDKLRHIEKLQTEGQKVLMLGDGLNDAGALKQSDVGISVSDDIHQFSPACDAILEAESLALLPSILQLSQKAMTIVKISFLLSIAYNSVGIYFAVSGHLSPIIAAILMPLSSISVALFTTIASHRISHKTLKPDENQFLT